MLPDAGLPHIRELAFLRAYDYPQALLGPGIQEEPIVEAGGRAAAVGRTRPGATATIADPKAVRAWLAAFSGAGG